MRILSCALFAFALPAQVSSPPSWPQWLDDLQKIQQEMYQAEIGSLDGRVEQAWRAALQEPRHPQFLPAAQMTASFYQSQGYDLKAEQALRQALAVVPSIDTQTRWNLMSQLAGHFENTQQLVKALAIREGMPKQPRPPVAYGQSPLDYDAVALANLHERMGEFEKAEAALKQAALPPAAETSQQTSEPGSVTVVAARAFDPGRGAVVVGIAPALGSGLRNELANFYARRGRRAEAEQIYKAALADAALSTSPYDWNGTADSYIGFLSQQRRFDEALDLARRSVDRLDASADPQAVHVLLFRRQQLARLLMQAGRPEEALAVQNQAVEAAQARGPGAPEHVQALASLADTLIAQKRFGEAEKVANQMREAGASDAQNARFHESMALQTLARIRDMQNRPDEARRLRENANVPGATVPARATTLFDVAGPAQQAAFQGNVADAVAAVDKVMAVAAERVRTNPQELSILMGFAQGLMARQKEQEARRIAAGTLALLDEAPDHPRVADALASVTSLLAGMGMTAEAERAIERQEKILISAKGAGSPALNAIGYGRIALMQRKGDWAGVLDERKRMLARTESATGSKSTESLYALREVAWAFPPLDDWAGEERVLAALLDRTVSVSGESSLDHAQLLVQMANRASQNREFDRALNWIDQAIEVARTLPDADMHLPFMTQNRAQIVKAKDVRTGAAPCTPASIPANPNGQWVDTNCFQRTDGARLGNAPPRAIIVGRPAVSRDGTPRTPVASPAQAAPPAPAKP